MVASDAEQATRVGVQILRDGGNAVDAAVATALALAVVYPQAGNLGGGGFMILRTPKGETAALDFRETAPKGASRDMFLDEKGSPTDKSLVGHLAAGVPGSVAGLWEAHRRHGALPFAQVAAPAMRLASEGFVVGQEFHDAIARQAERLGRFPASASLFLPGGRPPEVGTMWKNPDLAAVLKRIETKGPSGFYRGETAKRIVLEMRRGRGLINASDLSEYAPKWREPLEVTYRGHRVFSMPPPSSGGLALATVASVLEGYDLAKLGWHSDEALHLFAEACRRAFALRNHYLGDPDFVPIPKELFVGQASIARYRQALAEKATPSSDVTPGRGTDTEGTHTTHLSVVDSQGGAVALTTTLNTGFGCGVTVPGTGVLLNNEMDDFATAPGKPNVFGLVQGESNAVAPGKRMLSSMSPTIVVGPDDKVFLVTGASGGPTIITSVFQILSNVVDYRMNIAAAVSAPRIHHQHLPDKILVEPEGFLADTLRSLEERGHEVGLAKHRIGDAPSILRDGNSWTGTSEPRQAGGLALGF